MTLVIADTKAQADYWIKQLQLQDAKYVYSLEQVQGMHHNNKIIAVGSCRACYRLVYDLVIRGYTVEERYDTR